MEVPKGVRLSDENRETLKLFQTEKEVKEGLMVMADAFAESKRGCEKIERLCREMASDFSDFKKGVEILQENSGLASIALHRASIAYLLIHMNVLNHDEQAWDTIQEQLEDLLPIVRPRILAVLRRIEDEKQSLDMLRSLHMVSELVEGIFNGE